MGYVFLAAAVVSEVIATMSLRASDGFSKGGFAVVVVLGYVAAFGFLSLALQRGPAARRLDPFGQPCQLMGYVQTLA